MSPTSTSNSLASTSASIAPAPSGLAAPVEGVQTSGSSQLPGQDVPGRPGSRPRRVFTGWRRLLSAVAPPAVLTVLAVVIWHIIATTAFADRPYIVPAPSAVVEAAVENGSSILQSVWVTFYSSVIAYFVAVVSAVAIAVLMSQSRFVERSLYPFAVILQVTPVISVAPIIILWFGFGMRSIIVAAALIAFFPVLSNTLLGLRSVDSGLLDLFVLHGKGRIRRLVRLQLPSALPQIVAGLRISAGLGVIGVITGEFLIGTAGTYGGVGVRIIMAQATMQTPLLFALVFAATLLGLVFFWSVSGLGHLLLRSWHESARSRN